MKRLLILMLAVTAINVCKAQTKINKTGDTLTITSQQIKVIVIDGKTYYIIRTTDIKESSPTFYFQPSNIIQLPMNGGAVPANIKLLDEIRRPDTL